jgi:glycosyltransferase involved in cell wall biosynthesis
MKISYAITAHNEAAELKALLSHLSFYTKKSDEIVVQLDITATKEVKDVVLEFNVKVIYFPLNNDFASFKNNLKNHCTGNYIFQIDADELPSKFLLENIHDILDSNPTVDMILVPRINTVSGITSEHIDIWRWKLNENGWINFPDYQWRIYRNVGKITWMNKVHERLVGFTTHSALPAMEEYCLSHHKTIERQEKQNNYYDTI